MSENFDDKKELVKYYYDYKFWDKSRVQKAVGKWITEEEYESITGETL